MTKLRRFRADYIKTEEGTGIGIVEYASPQWDRETIAIHSLYVDKNISNRDASIVIFERVYNDLKEDQGAILQMSKFSFAKDWDKPYRQRMNVMKIETFRGRMYQAMLLAGDALRRKADISEVFDEPFHFSVIQQTREEEGENKPLTIKEETDGTDDRESREYNKRIVMGYQCKPIGQSASGIFQGSG